MNIKPSGEALPPIDAEAILRTLAQIRKSIPHVGGGTAPPTGPPTGPEGAIDGPTFVASVDSADALAEFEYLAVADGLEAVAAELSAAIDAAQTKALDGALDVYYAAEELARDPAHADLVGHVEEMRRAYQRTYGIPIPTREETAAARRRRKP